MRGAIVFYRASFSAQTIDLSPSKPCPTKLSLNPESQNANQDKTGLGAADIFDPMLIAAAPVTFIRYPAAWILRSPAVAFGFVGFSFALGKLFRVCGTGPGNLICLRRLFGFSFALVERTKTHARLQTHDTLPIEGSIEGGGAP